MKRNLLFIVLIGVYAQVAFSQTGIPRAQAMFIYNFSRLIEWPASYKSGPFIIGVVGNADIFNELKAYTTGKSVGSQSITVEQYEDASSIDKCHIIFVPVSKTKNLGDIVGSLQNKSTLIISEKKGAIDEGSAINFLFVGDKLRFEINSSNASKYGIKMSGKLEEMAIKKY